MRRAISEMQRSCKLQLEYDKEHGIRPETIRKAVTLILALEEDVHEASTELRFECAARLRDESKDLKRELRDVG